MTLMKRPVQVAELVSTVRTALRDRRRQYVVRELLAEHGRQAEALAAAEQRLRLMVESVQDYAIFSMDVAGRITTWNTGAVRVFGWAEDEIVGRSADVLFTPEDRAAGEPARELAAARDRGRSEDERWHLRADGSRFFASGVVTPIRDPDGRLLGFSKVCRDVTERKRDDRSPPRGRPAQGRVPGHAGPRAAEPARPDPQRPAGDAAGRVRRGFRASRGR